MISYGPILNKSPGFVVISVQVIDLTVFDCSWDVAMTTNFGAKSAKLASLLHLRLSHQLSETDCRIATTIGASTAVMTSEHLIENGDLPSSNSVVY